MSNANDHISPRVNSARLKDYVNASHPVRMTGKVLNFSNDETYFTMEAPDGGKIKVLLPPPPVTHGVTDTYVEIVGSVVDASTLNYMTCINMGSELDLKYVNDVLIETFSPRFQGRLF